jgi:DNA repair protein RadC
MSNVASSSESSPLLVRDLQGDYRPASADEVLGAARRLLGRRVRRGCALNSPQMVRDFLRIKLAALEHEVFAVLMLDAQHRLIEYQEMFRGTVTQTSVYPREVVKESLARNAVAVIFCHNHPSTLAQPSKADELLTRALKEALSLVDVQVLDHFIVAGDEVLSFAESGRL